MDKYTQTYDFIIVVVVVITGDGGDTESGQNPSGGTRAKLELFTLVSRNKYIIIIVVHSQVRDGGPKDPGSSRADCKRLAIDG